MKHQTVIIFLLSLLCLQIYPSKTVKDPIEHNSILMVFRRDLYARWHPSVEIFMHEYPEDPKTKILKRFEYNYLVAASILKYKVNYSTSKAANEAYNSVATGPLALHYIIHGKGDTFDENAYENVNCKMRMKEEIANIYLEIEKHYTDQDSQADNTK